VAKLSVDQALLKAKSHAKKGKTAEAQNLYQGILKAFPNNKRAQKGLAALNQSLAAVNGPPQGAINQLLNLYNQGQLAAAVEQAVALTKQYPEAFIVWNILGAANKGLGRADEASEAFKKVTVLNPNYADGFNNLGITLKDQGKLDKAIEAYSKALSFKPDYAEAYNNMGNALKLKGKLEEAIGAYNKAIAIKPDYADAYNNMGIAFKDQGKLEEAIEVYNKALSLKPDYAEAYNNMGNALNDQSKQEEAIEAYNKALLLKPDYADAYYNMSFAYNLQGEFQKGLELFEWRLKKKDFVVRPPREELSWDGSKAIEGKQFVIYDEQGLGDIIQFCRYLPLLEQKGAKVTFKVKQKLHTLLYTLDCNVVLTESFPNEKKINFEAPLMSLPYLFKTNLETIPEMASYLSADHLKVVSWGKRLSKDKFKIGICWQGSKNKIDVGRSFPLSLFEGISGLPNVELISLHKGEGEEQIKEIKFDLTNLGDDFDAGDDAFIDTAAVMANCDLIITSDTAIAHLSGALGCQTWVALKHSPDWRWMLDRNDSPWYPTMTLYRQKQRGNWKYVFDEMKQDLDLLLQQEKGLE
jgi:tetratricopeptide (TPR) repeat protein